MGKKSVSKKNNVKLILIIIIAILVGYFAISYMLHKSHSGIEGLEKITNLEFVTETTADNNSVVSVKGVKSGENKTAGSVTIPKYVKFVNGEWYMSTKDSLDNKYGTDSKIYKVTEIALAGFEDCADLENINIPDSINNIQHRAFKGCSSLSSINIPSSVTSIGVYVFAYCDSLSSISVESGNAIYDSRNSCKAIIETSTNTLVSGCKSTSIPSDVVSISEGAFAGCTGLNNSTIIPIGVTNIGSRAFIDCTGLSNIVIAGGVTTIGESAFSNCSNMESVTIPKSMTSIGQGAFENCNALSTVYYNGTEEEWNVIVIYSHNTPLNNATKTYMQ